MTYGLNTLAVDGSTQIDEYYKNFKISRSGSATASPVYTYGYTTASVVSYSVGEIVFIRPPYGAKVSWRNIYNTSDVITGFQAVVSSNASAVTYQYIVLTPLVPAAHASTFGLMVYGPDGTPSYDSQQRTFTVDTILSGLPVNTTVTVPAPKLGLRYFLLNTLTKCGRFSSGEGDEERYAGVCLNSETSVSLGYVETYPAPNSYYDEVKPPYFGMSGYI